MRIFDAQRFQSLVRLGFPRGAICFHVGPVMVAFRRKEKGS